MIMVFLHCSKLHATEKCIYMVNKLLNEYIGEQQWVEYVPQEKRHKYKLTIKNGVVRDYLGKRFSTVSLFKKQGIAIYVMDIHGNIYASKHFARDEFHHSSIVGGEPVAAAGTIEIDFGKVKRVSRFSGHYRPSDFMLRQFLTRLRQSGVDLRRVQIVDDWW